MKFKGTIWALIVFAGLISYYYFIDAPAIKKAEEEKELAEKILPFDEKDVQEITLLKSGAQIRLRRSGEDGWELVEPVAAKGDSITVHYLLAALKEVRFTRTVDEAPADLAPFGLAKPRLSISVKFKNKDEKSLLIGGNSQVGMATYVKLGGEKKVLLSNLRLMSLDKSASDLRDKTILDYNTVEVTSFELQRPENTLRFALDEKEKRWAFTSPVTTRADGDAVENFLNGVRVARIKSFEEESPADLSAFGLDKPEIILRVKSGDGESSTELRVGKKVSQKYYAQTDKRKTVFTIGGNLFAKLTQNYLDLMDKSLLAFKIEDVTQIRIRHLDQTTLVARTPDRQGWRIEKPGPLPADKAAVESLLLDLRSARIKEFVKFAQDDLNIFGLDKPRKEITLDFGEDKTASIKLGNSTSDMKQYFASRSDDGLIFVVDASAIDKIFRSRHDLLYKKLLAFKTPDVKRILLQYPGKKFELQLTGEKWSLLQPEKIDAIKPFIGKDILWTLTNLEYEAVLAPAPEPGVSGLDQPRLSVAIHDAKNEKLAEVIIGNRAEGKPQYYAQVKGNPEIYLIQERFMSEIPSKIGKFQK